MEVTPTGIAFLPIMAYLIFAGASRTLFFCVFIAPFGAMSVVNFYEPTFAVQPFYLAMLVVIMKVAVKEILYPSAYPATLWLHGGTIALLLLLAISTNTLTQNEPETREIYYFLYGFMALFATSIYAYRHGEPKRLSEASLWAALALILIGGWEFIAERYGIHYPKAFFNSSVSVSGNLHQSLAGYSRVTSATFEPSYFAKFISASVAIAAYQYLKDRYLDDRVRWLALSVIVGGIPTLLLTSSTTGYVGLALVSGALLSWKSVKDRRVKVLLPIGAVALVVVVAGAQQLESLIRKAVLEKAGSGSVATRMGSIADSWQRFVDNPIIGAGVGHEGRADVFVYMLGSVGVIGVILLALIIAGHQAVVHAAKPRRANRGAFRSPSDHISIVALNRGLIVFFVLDCVTDFSYTLGVLFVLAGVVFGTALRMWRDMRVPPVRERRGWNLARSHALF